MVFDDYHNLTMNAYRTCRGGGTEIQLGGAGVRGCKAANYPREASACKGQKLGGGSATLAIEPESNDELVGWFEDRERATCFAMQIASSISTYTGQIGG